MTKTEILMQYHGEVNKAVEGKHGVVARGQALGPIYTHYMMTLKAMLKGKSMSREEYDWITDRMIAINHTTRMA